MICLDPSGSGNPEADECGIIVSGSIDRHKYTLEDASLQAGVAAAQAAQFSGGRASAVAVAADAKPLFTPALDARAAFIVGDILSDGNARARTFGTDSVLATRFWSAVKTGTSKDMRDNWALGFSRRYTVGVWVGNRGGAPMHGVSGVMGAAPIWARKSSSTSSAARRG